MESQRLLPSKDPEASEESIEEEDWTDRSSYNSYSESDSDSTIPDWEPYVDDFSGELFYIDCHPFVTHSKDHNKSDVRPEPFSKSQLRRSTRGKFLRLLRRRESKRYSKKGQKPVEEGSELNTQKVKFQDFQEGEEKVVTLEIDSENRYNLSGDKSLAESLLGLIVSTLSDGSRVMIAGLYLTMIGTVYNVATQVLFLTLTTYIASQLKALKIYGKYSHLYCQSKTTDVAEYEENEVLRFFKSICSKHQDIIRFVDEVNLAMGNVLFMEYFLNSINIAAVMIRILMMSNTRSMLVFCIVLLLHQILQLFWMSWHANEIQIQSSSLSDALFQSKWYEQSERVKKIIFIVMMRSKKPLYIFIGPFFPMSIRTGIASMKAAYSYVTMIFTVASKD